MSEDCSSEAADLLPLQEMNEAPPDSLWTTSPLEATDDLTNAVETLSDTFIMTECLLAEMPPRLSRISESNALCGGHGTA